MDDGTFSAEGMFSGDAAERLHDLLVRDRELSGFLDDLAALTARELNGETEVLCGFTLERDRRNAAVGSSSAEARAMDEAQAAFDEGPCLEAERTGRLISVEDVRSEERWPAYMAKVRGHGVRSALAVPLDLKGAGRAAMNLYARRPAAFDDRAVRRAIAFAGLAGKAMRVALRIAAHAESAEHRRRAMETRAVVDLATGVLMAQMKCGQEEAVAMLKRFASQRNAKLVRLAEDIVVSVGGQVPADTFEA
ncbi:GAF and ANTAR domain-containing protein [Brevibacterium album]|uniref:GAF and ANTAR domain-containing protein n=1 Tax=Brevibacterium album TaxID=417948 RepID=UPI000409CB2B|nr:GAF and ANTAR domain-containing protein [Brevibacterium album]